MFPAWLGGWSLVSRWLLPLATVAATPIGHPAAAEQAGT
jgi:hypothetical protein